MTRRAENRILQLENKRRCLQCDIIKFLSDFCIESRNWSGRGARCKLCEKVRVSAVQRTPQRRAKINEREKNLIKTNPTFALMKRVRRAIRHLISHAKVRGSTRYLNYSAEQLKTHLESQFLNGMSWDNMEQWHIDHKRPLASFDQNELANPDSTSFKQAWALENLQPLWQTDNCSKGAKF